MVSVTIIGGGFAGMAAALCLKMRGIQSTIYETRDEAYTSGGNIALAPNALRVLDHVGLYEELRLQGYNYEELSFVNGVGSTLGVLLNGSQKVYHYQALRIHRTAVRDALRRACAQRGIEIVYEKKCIDVVEQDEGIVANFTDGSSVKTDFLIGADGIHSKVRTDLYPDGEAPHFSGLIGVMGTVMDRDVEDVSHPFTLPAMLFGDSGSVAIMPSSYSGDELGYFATLEADDRSREEWDTLGRDKTALKKMLTDRFTPEGSRWPDLVQAVINRTPMDSLTLWPFFSAPNLESWMSKSSQVFLIGDAAHAIPPTGGQGAAMAFEDAETLAYTIAEGTMALPNGKPASLSALTERWNKHRHARIAKVTDFTTKNGTLRKSSPHFYEQAAKEWIMWAMFKWTGPEAGVRWMYEYNAESVRAVFVD